MYYLLIRRKSSVQCRHGRCEIESAVLSAQGSFEFFLLSSTLPWFILSGSRNPEMVGEFGFSDLKNVEIDTNIVFLSFF